MADSSPRGDRFPWVLLLAAACSLGVPSLLAADSLLQPSALRLPGESGSAGISLELPPFLQSPAANAPAGGAVPQAIVPASQPGWIGDTWIWKVEQSSRFEDLRPAADAERRFAELDWWRRGFARITLVLLACALIASFAMLFTLAQRR